MYNLTYLGHRVTLPWLDLRSNFDRDLLRSNYTWFDAPWRDKHDGIKIVALPLQLKILSFKNRLENVWNFKPWWPQFWPEPKNDRNDFEMIFSELSNAVFRFVLRCAGAEIDGGGVQTPPPPLASRWWKIQRPSRARVKPRSVLYQFCSFLFYVLSKQLHPSHLCIFQLTSKLHEVILPDMRYVLAFSAGGAWAEWALPFPSFGA